MSRTKRFFSSTQIEDIISVSLLEPIGPLVWQRLYHSFPRLEAILEATTPKLKAAGLTEHMVRVLQSRPRNVTAALRLLKSKAIKIITVDDDDYPALLREIPDPPLWLYWRGEPAWQQTTLTVVGTRKPSGYALTALEKLLPEHLVKELCLVSGLAYGVDKAAHEQALSCQGKTVAVLAGGLDSVYPVSHHRLAERIIEGGGALLSEYPPLSRPRPARFPVRNRIIAGLSRATVVVEAGLPSGTLTTAKAALDYNREIFAVPGEILRPQTAGANFLIKHGATLLDDYNQLADFLGVKLAAKRGQLDRQSSELLSFIDSQALSPDQLSTLTRRPIEEILGLLTQLELSGAVYQPQPGLYQGKT